MQKALIVGYNYTYAIEQSFYRAFLKMGYDAEIFNINSAIDKYVKLGKFGKKVNQFIGVDTWIRKGNRELAVKVKKEQPDIIMVVANASITFSTLAFIRSISKSKLVLYWPDTLTNLTTTQLNAAPLYDAIATYSSSTIDVFLRMGFRKAIWMPFAADNEYLGEATFTNSFTYDVSFIGAWRPEREKAVVAIINNFPNLKVHIRGYYWKENSKYKISLKSLVAKPAYETAYGQLLNQSRINLNVIDDTNYPAANMRFFETSAVGGLQLCSSCPEQQNIFKEGEHLFYFRDESEMLTKVDFILNNENKMSIIRKRVNKFAMEEHQYVNRLKNLISFLNN